MWTARNGPVVFMLVSVPFPGGKVSCHVLLDLTYIAFHGLQRFYKRFLFRHSIQPSLQDVCVYADSRQSRINREIVRSIPPYY
jgi:hypothetical protein